MGSRLVDAGLDPSDVVDVKGIATILRTDICHVCNARSGDGKKLQKCAGCNIAVYCGRECQKAAWKAHRLVCRQTDSTRAIHQAVGGDRRPQAVEQGLRNSSPGTSEVPLVALAGFHLFKNLHAWSIQTMCHAAVHLMAGGRGAESFRRDPVVIRFDVHPSEIPQAKPWNAWVLGKWRIQSLDYLLKNDESFAANWEVGKPAREQEEREHRAKFGSRLVGELPVQFFVGTTHTSIHALQPILRLREPEDLQDLTTRGAVQDLFNLCLGYTNKGVPLGQAPLCPQLAFPGRSVKIRPDGDPDEKKVWGWEPRRGRRTTEHPWDSNLHIEIFRRLGRKTNLPPMDLILLFYNLTAEEPCRSIAIGRRTPIAWDRRFLPLIN